VGHSKAGVKYLNLNDERHTGTDGVQAMRDDMGKSYGSA
jgi:hypothetical protein